VINLPLSRIVDRSIDGPGDFIQTNIVGTTPLEAVKAYLGLAPDAKLRSGLHVSTDEVCTGPRKDESAFHGEPSL
jgi:dTDP-glucose 4,6-dehydratase